MIVAITVEEEFDRLRNEAAAEDEAGSSTASKTYSASRSADHALIVEDLAGRGIPRAVAGDLANELADRFRSVQGSWPTVFELLSDPQTINRITYTNAGLYALPPAFGVRDDRTGLVTWYRNSPLSGVQPVGAGSDDFGFGLKELASGDSRLPVFGSSEVATILSGAGFGTSSSGGGGGGGGGVAPKPPVWDRAELTDSATTIWRGLLLEEPDSVDRIVDDYVGRATSFLMNEGGRLDFETFVLGQARSTAKYQTLYRNKQPGVTEQGHLAQYLDAYRRLGLADRGMAAAVTAGASSGASPQGFTERLQRSPEYMQANQGSFSQRFGNTISQLGIRGT
jgi:hypothetical protein